MEKNVTAMRLYTPKFFLEVGLSSNFEIKLLTYGSNIFAILTLRLRGALNKFPDFFVWALLLTVPTKTLIPFKVFSFDINALVVPFQQLLESPLEVFLCERV